MPTVFPPTRIGPLLWEWKKTCIFGVVNVTPDSFFDGGRYHRTDRAVDHALALAEGGAHVLDVGGESTRPGSDPVSTFEECDRVVPVIEGIRARIDTPISVDTTKAEVAEKALAAGADIVNDISGLGVDPRMAEVVAGAGASVILGHLRGAPATMQQGIAFGDVVREVADELRLTVQRAVRAGIGAEQIWVDPGIGFGKTAEQSLVLIHAAGQLRRELGYPVMVGPSRKSFIGAVTGEPPEQRLMGTCAAVAVAITVGVDAVRIHDVAELRPAILVADAICRTSGEG